MPWPARRPFEPLHLRRQDLSDGARVDVPVGMAANANIYRAVIQAGAAADAQQGLAQFRIGQDVRAAVVQR
jgi:hypothetical protein